MVPPYGWMQGDAEHAVRGDGEDRKAIWSSFVEVDPPLLVVCRAAVIRYLDAIEIGSVLLRVRRHANLNLHADTARLRPLYWRNRACSCTAASNSLRSPHLQRPRTLNDGPGRVRFAASAGVSTFQ